MIVFIPRYKMKGIYLITRYLRLNIFTLAMASLLIIYLAGNAMALPPTATPEEQNTPVKSSAIVADLLKVILRNIRNGKFAGRVIADIYTGHGESIAQEMLRANLARSYHGKKRQPWCDTNKL